MLDVGCGAGAFMRFASDRGWSVEGTDVTVTGDAREVGGRIWEGQLPAIDFGDERFDVVRFNHVLEHTPDPLAELRRARALLTIGGILLIGVPNMAGASIRVKSWQSRLGLKRRAWKHYGALHHLWFFTPSTLGQLVETADFTVERWETPVAGRAGRSAAATALIRPTLEILRVGGVLDLYARTV
jgi:2-polyprenyl-3-methyl-5-hydroxy-6-metoxy-1,4-benzoquinol methylase